MQPDNAGWVGALVKMDGKDSGVGGTVVYFTCADCAVESSRAVENGGRDEHGGQNMGQVKYRCPGTRRRSVMMIWAR
jgi:predicted enzyme related to lactoylglutathione lyase